MHDIQLQKNRNRLKISCDLGGLIFKHMIPCFCSRKNGHFRFNEELINFKRHREAIYDHP